jgi:hypothetical protein
LHSSIRGNELCHPCHTGPRCRAVVAFAQVRDHLPPDIAGARIVNDGLQAVTDFNLVLSLLRRNQNQNAIVFALGADAKVLVEVDGVVFARLPFQRIDRHHGDLCASLLLDFGGQELDLLSRRRIDHARQIGDISLRSNVVDFLRKGTHGERDQQQGGIRARALQAHHPVQPCFPRAIHATQP